MLSLVINKIVSSVIQVIVFSLVPFVWWFVTARKNEKFGHWIGLKKVPGEKQKTVWTAAAVTALLFVAVGAGILYFLRGTEMATSDFDGMGASAIPAILIYAFFNTALPEEILFRGFLLKRISSRFGFLTANLVQAILFALLHGAMFVSILGAVKAIVIIVFTGVIAYGMGYINEKKADGSILPSWMIHAASNIFSGLASAFLLF